MNLLRKKIYFSTLIKMGAALLFILIGIGAGIGSGTINEIGEYFRGFKVEKINSSAELMNIKKYNTKTIEVKEIYPLQIDYFDGFSKKKFQKQKVPQGSYYLAEYDGSIIFLIGKEKDFVKKENGLYEIKGKLEFLRESFIQNYYASIVSELENPQNLKPVVVNAASPWKRETGCYLSLFFFAGVPALLFFIKYLLNIINIEKHPVYRKLNKYGNWQELKQMVESEIENGEYEECESQIITKNFIIVSYMHIRIIPKNMILRTFVKYNIRQKMHKMARVEFFLLSGDYEELFSTEKRVLKVVNWFKEKVPQINIDEENSPWSIGFEMIPAMDEFWKAYCKKENSPLKILEEEKDSELMTKKEEYIELIENKLREKA